MKSLLPIFLILLILVSCGSGTVENNNTQQETETTETTELNYYKNIPTDLNYDGYTFTFFTYDAASWDTFVDKDEMTGDVLNDAAYMRNSEVAGLLNIEFATVKRPEANLVNAVITNNTAGDNTYDLILFWAVTNVSNLIVQNQVYDWKTIPYVNLDEPWYNHTASDTLTVNGKQYFGVSDISYTIQQQVRFLFNKELFDDLNLEYPYQLVYDGKWTLDKVFNYIKDVYSDVNGDGKRDKDDRYGMDLNAYFLAYTFAHWGEYPIGLDANGFTLNIFNNRISDMMDKLVELSKSNDVAFGFTPQYSVFNAGNALFEGYASDPAILRDIEFEFGYIPYPKWNEAQPDYITWTLGGLMGVPIIKTSDEMVRTGIIIEALSAASNKYIVDAFVEKFIEGKVLRDEDSVNMYRLMRRTATYERARIFDTTNLLSGLAYYTDCITKSGTVNLASQYAANGSKIEEALKNMYESILENQ